MSGSKVPTRRSFHPFLAFNAVTNPPGGTSGLPSPTRTVRRSAVSSTQLHMGPAVSRWQLIGIIPSFGTEPKAGLIVYKECREDGEMREPVVSEPTAIAANPAATAIAHPEEEPPVLCWSVRRYYYQIHVIMKPYAVPCKTVMHVLAPLNVRILRLAMHCRPATANAGASEVDTST